MIAVTGAAGFIGSCLIAELNKRGVEDILAVDELGSDEKWKNLRRLKIKDYLEKDDFLSLLLDDDVSLKKNISAILHMGACSSTTETDCTYLIKNNFEYSKILCKWALENAARFVYASSAATYGNGENGFSDEHSIINSLEPLNMYGFSKHLFDKWALACGALNFAAGFKYFNVFGPNEYHKGSMQSFVLKAFEQIRDTGRVRLFKSENPDYGHGEQLRDFVYVKDITDMTLFALERRDVCGIFNAGTGETKSWNRLAKAVFASMNKEPEIEYIDMPENLKGKYQYYTKADMKKLRDAGCSNDITEFEEAVRDYVQNYLQKGNYYHS
ncbi:ADP-glyceromanno-heptose 6-epimerase [Sedimentisphaera salicampi]|uniref:ADP-L-glycero-D-manno-heptose-6-epimerase n=1 Tax=Sedimentisphaera salicampi TaxID=1941349 RepID=A0A1W6LPA8_9BACT|nr:ADP-glyceromanno-heptose 6-epimerase [Sedimentisphaera salicampi]ARN57619.1 ADP-L-glycero-D-manno-heptose-6-epimerase [Sedimentisphaera salicampi]OXU14187.1 ADP-L-glycero-D-manno-heptose-6-epimerase [Sedimentisphaera salicampi]